MTRRVINWRPSVKNRCQKKAPFGVANPEMRIFVQGKVKKIKRLCGGVVYYAAQASAQIDAEIGQNDHLWLETFRIRVIKKSTKP
ncbi:MAG: hypothetical protein PVH85_34025 [Desulfobacterales bacterium]